MGGWDRWEQDLRLPLGQEAWLCQVMPGQLGAQLGQVMPGQDKPGQLCPDRISGVGCRWLCWRG